MSLLIVPLLYPDFGELLNFSDPIVSLLSYHWSHGSWLQFALLFLLPDLSMLGYAANNSVGAITYNAVHTYVGPLVLAGYLCLSRIPSVSPPASLWDANRRSPRCTLVSLLAAHRSLKTGSLCLVQSSSAFKCGEFASPKNPILISKSLVG
jgi:Domain of unknown function (DUF4260)